MSDQETPAPEPRTAAATRARRFHAQRRRAEKLIREGWTCTPPPDMAHLMPAPTNS